jgi:hypothetical protein
LRFNYKTKKLERIKWIMIRSMDTKWLVTY